VQLRSEGPGHSRGASVVVRRTGLDDQVPSPVFIILFTKKGRGTLHIHRARRDTRGRTKGGEREQAAGARPGGRVGFAWLRQPNS